MFENNPNEIEQIEEKAMKDDRHAKMARQSVTNTIAQMNPQRQYSEDRAQNKR